MSQPLFLPFPQNSEQFLDLVVGDFYRHMDEHIADNFDERRFNEAHARQFLEGYRQTFLSYFIQNYEGFYKSFVLLADDYSRRIFMNLLLYKMLGWEHVKIGRFLFTDIREHMQTCDMYEAGPSSYCLAFRGMKMVHYQNFPFEGKHFSLDTVSHGLMHCFCAGQYDYLQGDVSVRVTPGDVVIDAGAYLGDTIIKFALQAGENGAVHAFDPLPAHVEISRYNIAQNGMDAYAFVHPYGLAEASNGLPPLSAETKGLQPNFKIEDGADDLPLRSIDGFVRDEGLNTLDYIKMDIEGAELSALEGAVDTIARFRPKLAISLYHKLSDFIDIPQFLHARFPFYRFTLDHYTVYSGETVLYAIDEAKIP